MNAKVGLDVWGDFACFTRPDGGKVERLSYPALTPSAARGIVESVYYKRTEFRYQIEKIYVLNPIEYVAVRRNEVKEKGSYGTPILTTSTEFGDRGRTQRQSICLWRPKYRIIATIKPYDGRSVESLYRQFMSRAKSGQCFQRPFFGCREFACFFEWADPDSEVVSDEKIDMDCGLMLYDVFDLRHRAGAGTDSIVSPSFFRAKIKDNVIEVPPYESALVLKTS